MADIDHDMIWDAVDELKSLNTNPKSHSHTESSDDEYSQYCIARKKTTPVAIVLPNGQVHVCGGDEPCSFLQPNRENLLICEYSGMSTLGPHWVLLHLHIGVSYT